MGFEVWSSEFGVLARQGRTLGRANQSQKSPDAKAGGGATFETSLKVGELLHATPRNGQLNFTEPLGRNYTGQWTLQPSTLSNPSQPLSILQTLLSPLKSHSESHSPHQAQFPPSTPGSTPGSKSHTLHQAQFHRTARAELHGGVEQLHPLPGKAPSRLPGIYPSTVTHELKPKSPQTSSLNQQ